MNPVHGIKLSPELYDRIPSARINNARQRKTALNYGRIGAVGYGLNIIVLLSTAAFTLSIVFTQPIPMTYNISHFNLVSFVTPIPALLISVAWWGMGRDHKSNLFLATGLVGFMVFLAGLAEVIWIGITPIPTADSQNTPAFLMSLLPLLALSLTTGSLTVAAFLLETASFFSAGKALQNKSLRYAGWSRIFAIVAACIIIIIASVLGLLSFLAGYGSGGPTTMQYTPAPTPTPAQAEAFARVFSLALAAVYLILCVPELFAFFGFRRIPTPQPTTPIVQPASTPAPPVEPPPTPI